MCEFASWIEYDGEVYFLTNADLDTLAGKKLLEPDYVDDICGHGAIMHFYPELRNKGIHNECENFMNPNNFPEPLVTALKTGRMSRIGIPDHGILNREAASLFNKKKKGLEEKRLNSRRKIHDEQSELESYATETYRSSKKCDKQLQNIDSVMDIKLDLIDQEYIYNVALSWSKIVKDPKNRTKAWK